MKKFLFPMILLFLTLSCCLIFLEVALRIKLPPSPFNPYIPLRPKENLLHHVKIKGLSPTARFTTNRWGLRGNEPPEDWKSYFTIVTIGGSTTQCYYLDDEKTWSSLLQKILQKKKKKIWVGNGGLDGHSTRGHILFMKEVIPKIKPDLVVLLIGINDVFYSLSEENRIHGTDYERVGLKTKIFASSRLFQVLYIWKLIHFDKVTVVQQAGHAEYVPEPIKGKAYNLPKSQREIKKFAVSLPEYRENIQKIIHLAKEQGVQITFLTQPSLYSNNAYWRKIKGTYYWIKKQKQPMSAADHWRLLDIFNKELLEVCEENKIPCLDIATQIPHSRKFMYDSFHFTEEGTKRIAQSLGHFLQSRGFFSSKVQ